MSANCVADIAVSMSDIFLMSTGPSICFACLDFKTTYNI